MKLSPWQKQSRCREKPAKWIMLFISSFCLYVFVNVSTIKKYCWKNTGIQAKHKIRVQIGELCLLAPSGANEQKILGEIIVTWSTGAYKYPLLSNGPRAVEGRCAHSFTHLCSEKAVHMLFVNTTLVTSRATKMAWTSSSAAQPTVKQPLPDISGFLHH